jgi:hypothetical protein
MGASKRRCCTRAGQAVLFARDLRDGLEDAEVDRDALDGAVGADDAAVRRAGLDRDLGDAGALLERPAVDAHVGAELFRRRVLLADLADLAADGNRISGGWRSPDELRETGAEGRVHILLRLERRLREVDQRRGVDVDL